MTTTWNPSDKASGITLSNSNLTATGSSGNNSVRGTLSQSGGKRYLEFNTISFGGQGDGQIGFANSTYSLTANTGSNAGSVAIRQFGGILPSGSMGSAPDGNVVCCAIDLDNELVWFAYNGTNWNGSGTPDPATGVGGISYSGLSGGTTLFPMVFFQNLGNATINADSGFAYSIPSGFVAWSGTSSPTGTWASTEATDVAAMFGYVPDSGTWASTEAQDTWSTSSGFTRLGVENPVANNGSPIKFTTNGPDRILILMKAGVAVSSNANLLATVTSASGVTWQGESIVVAGADTNSDDMNIEFWWAYAHNQLTNDSVTVTEGSGGTTTENYIGFAVKGLNGNYNYPFEVDNPLSWGTAIGAFFGSDTTPKAFLPYSDGPINGLTTSYPSFVSGNAVGVTLSGSNLELTSTGSGSPDNYAFIDPSDAKSGGKYYFEVEFNTINGSDYGAGFMYAGSVISTLLSNGTNGAIVRGDGSIWNGSDVSSLGLTPSNGDIIGIALDFDNGLAWFKDITAGGYWNGNLSANPTFGVDGVSIAPSSDSLVQHRRVTDGGAYYAAAIPFGAPAGTSSAAMTFNFGATSFTGTAPTGFIDWGDYATVSTFTFPAITIAATISVTNSGYGALDTFSGFTQAALAETTGSQRAMSMLGQYEVRTTNVRPQDNVIFQGTATAPSWLMLYDTIVPGVIDPGSWESTEATDTMTFVGHPGASGVVGDLLAVDGTDVATIFGFERDSGIWVSTEAKDIFGAEGHQPLTGTFNTTETADKFAATGVGLGENGIWVSTEGVDTLTMFGVTPVRGPWISSEIDDRFVAIGAGVTRLARRRRLIVT